MCQPCGRVKLLNVDLAIHVKQICNVISKNFVMRVIITKKLISEYRNNRNFREVNVVDEAAEYISLPCEDYY